VPFAAADVELTSIDLAEIEKSAAKIQLEGERYPEHLMKTTGRHGSSRISIGSPDLHQLTLLAFATRWTCRVCPLPLANGMTLPTISTTGFLTVSIPKRR
jgi:hypothetical protein